MAIKESKNDRKVKFDNAQKKMTSIPSYGSKYGTIKIDKINLDLPLYYGDNEEILSYGIGHYAGSYFPGEGGSVILAGHNDPGYFEKILELGNNDKIVLDLNYGKFDYQIYETRIVSENDLSAFPIQDNEERLILYTCYPLGVGHKTERFVVYAHRVGETDA
ncbi:MAG: class D sortase [Bacilli bacterium]|nr:class D sortase [Bacilli bacterium]